MEEAFLKQALPVIKHEPTRRNKAPPSTKKAEDSDEPDEIGASPNNDASSFDRDSLNDVRHFLKRTTVLCYNIMPGCVCSF